MIYRGKRSGLWVGTIRDGLNRFGGRFESGNSADTLAKADSFRRYRAAPVIHQTDQFPRTGPTLNNNGILSLYEDESGVVWIGTFGGGINRYDPSTNLFTYYTTQDGLPNDVVYGILADNKGRLWLSTNKGLSRFDPESASFRNFDVRDGLQANEFNRGACFVSKTGEMFFGGVNGFNSFFPDSIEGNDYVPSVYVTSFKVFNRTLPLTDPIPDNTTIRLLYAQNYFSFEFVALSYTSSEKNQYAYMLEGFDKDWHTVSSQQRFASYTNLDPENYILRVKASNNDGVWNEKGTSIAIVITPPYWMTWWFRGLGGVAFLLLLGVIYRRHINTLERKRMLQQEISNRLIEKQEEERSRIAQEMHDSLGQELLFIKNRALLTIRRSELDPVVSQDLTQISDASSKVLKTLREISHNLRPPELDRLGVTETLRAILLKVRNSTAMTVSGEVDEIDGLIAREKEINFVRVVQEALGNVVKHAMASECSVRIVRHDNQITIEIADNGKGFDIDGPHAVGLGLTGITERVRMLGGSFEIHSTIGRGTQIAIEIPICRKGDKIP